MAREQPAPQDRPTTPVPAERRRPRYDSLLPPTLADIADALDAISGPRPPSRNAQGRET